MTVFLFSCTHTGPLDPGSGSVGTVSSPTGIPLQYIPSPGNCRIWYPDRIPDDQPPPERCLEIGDVPAGAWLVYGGAVIRTYRIEEYDPERPGKVIYINYFEAKGGRFLRQEKICP